MERRTTMSEIIDNCRWDKLGKEPTKEWNTNENKQRKRNENNLQRSREKQRMW